MSRAPKYAIEYALDKLVAEFRELLIAMKKFFFRVPKNREDAMIYMITVTPWVALIGVVIYRI